jgi:vacuolar protein 8
VIERVARIHALLRVAEASDPISKIRQYGCWRGFSGLKPTGKIAHDLLIDLAQKGNIVLKPMIGKLVAHLERLQTQSTYF